MIGFKRMLKKSIRFKVLVYYLAFAMALLTGLPGSSSASTVPTAKSLAADSQVKYDRDADMALIVAALQTENGQTALKQADLTMEEFQGYLGQLNDAQLNLVAEKIRAEMPAGGHAEGLFWAVITVLVLLFIIFLVLDLTGVYKLPFRRG